jgi:hypothetical protein
MALKQAYIDWDGVKVSVLKDWLLNPLSTADRTSLGSTLSTANVGLVVFDTTLNELFFWGGSGWVLSGGGGTIAWGNITGDINAQTDLQDEFALKVNISSLATVAFTGDYNDLLDKPVIPPGQVNSDWNATSGVAEILNKPFIYEFSGTTSQYTRGDGTYATFPVVVSAFINDVGYITGITGPEVISALGYTPVPNTRNLTINGLTQDLSADRTWIIPATTPGGTNTDIQFNNGGTFGGTSLLTWNGTLLQVSGSTLVSSLSSSGTTMVVATSTGLLSTQPLPSATTPGGNNKDVQFNNNGVFGGSDFFAWDNTNHFLGIGTSSPSTTLSISGATISGSGSTGLVTMNQTWNTTGNPTAILLNIIKTAAGTNAKFIDLQVGGSSIASISPTQYNQALGGSQSAPAYAIGGDRGMMSGGSGFLQIVGNNTVIGQFQSGNATLGQGPSLGIATGLNVGPRGTIELGGTFNSNGGSFPGGSFNSILVSTTINQTAGATGTMRGLYIQPTITAALDWRAIEVAQGITILNGNVSGTTTSTSLLIQTTGISTSGNTAIASPAIALRDNVWNGSTKSSVTNDILLYNAGAFPGPTVGPTFIVAGTQFGAPQQMMSIMQTGNVSGTTSAGINVTFGVPGGISPSSIVTLGASNGTHLLMMASNLTQLPQNVIQIPNTLEVGSTSGMGGQLQVTTSNTGAGTNQNLNMLATWNTTGAPTAILLNVTNTASASGSTLMDLRVGGTSQFTIGKAGTVFASGSTGIIRPPVASTALALGPSITTRSHINLAAGTAPTSPQDGDIWYDGTNIKMQIGGVTKTFTLT